MQGRKGLDVIGTQEWMDQARCANIGPIADSIFFPGAGGSTRRALAICSQCPVTDACLEYALANRFKVGVWGGKTETARRKILRERSKDI